jgi:1-acyl-sn-glycerol-3-phosphate acyltransferase
MAKTSETEIDSGATTAPAQRPPAPGHDGARPLPEPSPWVFRLFGGYAQRYVARHFHAVRLAGAAPAFGAAGSGPLVVYLNHAAWWDPLTCLLLATRFFPGRTHYAPIDAPALGRYGFFRKLGFFGVEQGTRRGAAQFLRAGLAALSRPSAVLWVTAEGEFRDPRRRPVELRPGVAHLLRRMAGGRVLPLAVEYPFWQERTPELLARFGEAIDVAPHAGDSVAQWQARLAANLEDAMDRLAADSMRRDPARFQTLLGGRAGVGGVYDLWRRAAALVRREPFRAEHGGRS